MRRRVLPYTIFLLLSCLLSILPAAMYFDLVTPLDRWNDWYWSGQSVPRPLLTSSQEPPWLLRAEQRLFQFLVTPPSLVTRLMELPPGTYGLPLESLRSGDDTATSPPPVAQALQFFRIAFPLWLVALALIYEIAAAVGRRLFRRGAR